MPIKVISDDNKYNLSEHAYIFLSLIYAMIIADLFSNLTPRLFILDNLFQTKCFSDLIVIIWSLFLVLFIIESWWGARLEQDKLSSFWNFAFFLLHPTLLFALERVLFNGQSFIDTEKNLLFAGVVCLILLNLILSRNYFDNGNFNLIFMCRNNLDKDIKRSPFLLRTILFFVSLLFF